jgi:hypothetical protein
LRRKESLVEEEDLSNKRRLTSLVHFDESLFADKIKNFNDKDGEPVDTPVEQEPLFDITQVETGQDGDLIDETEAKNAIVETPDEADPVEESKEKR